MSGVVYGFGCSEKTAPDNNTHTYILTNKEDLKNFHEERTKLLSGSRSGSNSWGGRITIGQPVTRPTSNSEFQVYEVIVFDKELTDTQIFQIYDEVFA